MPEWATEINDNLRLASTQNVAFSGNTTAGMQALQNTTHLQCDLSLMNCNQESGNNEDIWMVSTQPPEGANHFLI